MRFLNWNLSNPAAMQGLALYASMHLVRQQTNLKRAIPADAVTLSVKGFIFSYIFGRFKSGILITTALKAVFYLTEGQTRIYCIK